MKCPLDLIDLSRICPANDHLGNQALQVSSLLQLAQHFLDQGGVLVKEVHHI